MRVFFCLKPALREAGLPGRVPRQGVFFALLQILLRRHIHPIDAHELHSLRFCRFSSIPRSAAAFSAQTMNGT